VPGFVIRLAINVLGLWLATVVVDNLQIEGLGTFVAAGLLLGIVNALVRPIVVVLTLPVTFLTLGFFLLIVNGLMLWLVASMLSDFNVGSFTDAFFGAVIVSLTGWVGSWYVGPKGNMQIMVVESRRG
jgi:putative membrane protein